uniref:MARVEL domain-containing protein n=1 Tax=Ceratitis capitata TaxID=7213 RepID=W8BXS5_CERCA
MDQYRKKRRKSKFFFTLNMILEGVAIGAVIYCTLFSSCVLGNEVSGPVFIFLLFIFSAFIPDVCYVLLTPKLHTLGIDPLGVMFNFLMGVLCLLIGLGLILVMLAFCGYYAQFILVAAGALSVCSGIFHLMNACMCHKSIPKSERYYKPRRSRTPKKGKEQKPAKAEKKAKSAEKKTAKKSEKKPDKPVKKKARKAEECDDGKKGRK